MTHFNFANKFASTRSSIVESKSASAFLFAALLIVCSVAVGCSSEKPQPVSVNQPPATNPAPLAMSTPPVAAEPAKPAPKKAVRKRPPTITYADKTYGVSFDYPRKYAIETGNAAGELIATSPLPMNFVQPGGTALAAVELPETSFPATDYSSAFFNVSVNKSLTAEQCEQFSVPQSKPSDPSVQTMPQSAKLMIGDMELYGAEAVAGDGPRQSDSKYFHIFQNGACYEFALNMTTNAAEIEAGMKHVDRDKVFDRLAKILSTVKINEVAAPEVTASAPAMPAASEQSAPTVPAASETPVPAAPAPPSAPTTPESPSDTTASTPSTPVAPSAPETSPQ
jgi:hypothetical protein